MVMCVYTTEYYSPIRKEAILPLAATWVNVQDIMRSEISQTRGGKKKELHDLMHM